ncbi:MAG: ABC transporter permease [Bacteroidales bacterium]|nr:ABC transporter permease [Bacteroidales bacterium]MDD4669815.1 ABC transporter permease [Bacteroidales bacterium]
MFDLFNEILSTLKKNRLRTFLTGFSMAWGIFMLITLLGAGAGLKNGIFNNYGGQAMNRAEMWPGRTSMPYDGLQVGRRTIFDEKDPDYLKDELDEISVISPTRSVWNLSMVYGQDYISTSLAGVYPEFNEIDKIKIIEGRNINGADIKEARKVIVIHKRSAKSLFKDVDPLGKYVVITKIPFLVVGVYSDDDMSQEPSSYAPITTVGKIFGTSTGYSSIAVTIDGLKNVKETNDFDLKLKTKLAKKHQYDPNDNSAIYYWSMWKQYLEMIGVFSGINLFIWIIGIGTLIAGIVGISNIMLITVKERTKEFGIRKSLGAKPSSIIKLIIVECLMITGLFGFVGMLFGIGAVELMNVLIKPSTDPDDLQIFLNPSVNLTIVVAATAVLMLAGLLAGYVPAKKAVKIKPIEALRYE